MVVQSLHLRFHLEVLGISVIIQDARVCNNKINGQLTLFLIGTTFNTLSTFLSHAILTFIGDSVFHAAWARPLIVTLFARLLTVCTRILDLSPFELHASRDHPRVRIRVHLRNKRRVYHHLLRLSRCIWIIRFCRSSTTTSRWLREIR